MSAPRIDTVLFDAAGTLFTVAEPVGDTYASLARPFGGTLRGDALSAGFRRVFPSMPPLAFPGADPGALDALERDWWRALVADVVAQAGGVPEFDAYFDALYAHYASAGAWRVYDEVLDVIAALRARGCRIAVVSNFDSRLVGLLDEMALTGRVDAVICSGGAGAAKPDPAIFAHALDRMEAAPDRTVHVGDSEPADYQGATGAGLHALLVCRHGAVDAPHRIPDLRGVLAYLDA